MDGWTSEYSDQPQQGLIGVLTYCTIIALRAVTSTSLLSSFVVSVLAVRVPDGSL